MELKKELIENAYSLLCDNGYHSSDSGIRPILSKVIEDRYFFKDTEVADKVIGKAAALLLVYSGVKKVYGLIMSQAGKEVLEDHGVKYAYDELVPFITNMRGDGMCPMELCVSAIDEPQAAYEALKAKLSL